ncbi:polysaccharide biosynthesis/export family protein [Flavobacterium branchiophilum]|uniref:Polysaccharide export outer membrane protein n=1 Tax=Flavobacterium branchiophilum TaxID=55197 RepID=A0A543G637_9FLAO|nr:polysaccharide biosynthesis/export family protein [Flavobacterium branchiophilum]TQM41553.1 polysaccharide export outer membrane protein [Flavobacterium branchiophilum]GEM55135.1 polysaccharide biosynthesis protein [Flavobacterium branchiophilum NBRC 15030 = ATCC 35035]
MIITKQHFTNKIGLKFLCFLFLGMMASSCTSSKDIILLQDVHQNTSNTIQKSYINTIQPDDNLAIFVSSSDNVGVQSFNMPVSAINVASGTVSGIPKQITYLVKQDGSIEFPVLGKIQVSGLTMLELTEMLKNKLKTYLNNPIVNIELQNFKVTVLGEVNKPGVYPVNQERITIFEALGLAGDLNITAIRKNVLVIREINKEQKYFNVDLTSKNIFESDVYYLKKNDVVIVAPNNAKIKSASYNANTPVLISLASVVLSLIIILTK